MILLTTCRPRSQCRAAWAAAERAGPFLLATENKRLDTPASFGYCAGMPDPERKNAEDTAATLREAVNNAYGYLKGSETTSSFQAVTFEEAMQRQLDVITGANGAGPSEIQQIQKVQSDLASCINTIQSTSPDQFYDTEDNNDNAVNTPTATSSA